MSMSKKLKPVVLSALLSALALVLYLLEFPLFPAAGFLKMDFSDVPALLGATLLGPGWGVLIELIKNLLGFVIRGAGDQMGFGNIMNFIVGTAFILPFSLIFRRGLKRGQHIMRSHILGGITGTITIAAVGVGMNMVIMPLFFRYFVGTEISMTIIMASIGYATALNVIKGVVLSFAATLHYPVERIVKKI